MRPIVASIHAPATLLSQLLNDLLAPIYLNEARATTFINSIDVVRRLEKYADDGYMTATTKFIIADVKNLYTMIPRQGALEALAAFCIRHSKQGKIGPFTIDHIMKIARLILDTNTFVYNDKYYRQTRGGAMGSAFTQVLANIYMYQWEQDLIRHQAANNEICGRFIDDMLMTTNETIDEMKQRLDQAANKDVNIKINYQIDRSVDFLDVSISNEDGRLRTKVYHKSAAEPYILPFMSTHPQHIQRNIPYGAILRAARISSNLGDFHSELCHIDVSLLLNGYPPNFIRKQFNRLFQSTPIVSMSDGMNEESYQQLHHRLLHQPTRHEQQLKKMMSKPIESPSVLQPYGWNKQIMFPHYLFDHERLGQLREAFMNWWRKHFAFPDSPLCEVKVRLVGDTQKTLEKFLIQKKPRRDLLTKME